MALAVDGTTPAAVGAASGTVTTASFTAPTGALLVAFAVCQSADGITDPFPFVSDTGGLNWTRTVDAGGDPDQFGASVVIYWAITPVSVARTVSLVGASDNTRPKWLRCIVFTGAWLTAPYGPVGLQVSRVGATAPSTSWAAIQAGSWGWMVYGDFDHGAAPTAGTGCTIDASTITSLTAAVIKRTAASTALGSAVTLASTAPFTRWSAVAVEILPAPPAAAGTDRRPQLVVECAFTTNPNGPEADNPVWVDITPWVRSIEAQRSERTWEYDAFQAGTMSVALDNRTGRFSPSNGSSPYWPNVLLFRPIRARAIWPPRTGGSYPIWTGCVERWPQKWNDPGWGESNLTCVDAMANLSQIILDSTYASEVYLDGPTAFYQLTEPAGAPQAGNTSAADQPSAPIIPSRYGTADTAFGAAGIVADSASSLALNPTEVATKADYLDLSHTAGIYPTAGTGWTLEMWAHRDDVITHPPVAGPLFAHLAASTSSTVRTGIETVLSRTFIGQVSLLVNSVVVFDSPGDYLGPGPLHLVVSISAAGVVKYYINASGGVPNYSGSPALGRTPTAAVVGGDWYVTTGPFFVCRCLTGMIALYDYELPPLRVAGHFTVGRFGGYTETTGQRATRILNYAAWPAWQRSIQTGLTYENPLLEGIGGRSALDVLQTLASDEAGGLWIDALGRVVFESRTTRPSTLAPAITFDPTAGTPVPYRLDSVAFDYDPTYVYNTVAVTRTGGVTVSATDDLGAEAYFPRDLTLTIGASDDNAAVDRANGLLDRYNDPALRLENLTVDLCPGPASSIIPLLMLDISDRCAVNHRPYTETLIPFDGYVDGILHSIDEEHWQVGLLVSPRGPDYWLLAAMHTTIHTAVGSGATTLTLDALPDAAVNMAVSSMCLGSKQVYRAGALLGTVTVTFVGATSVGYSTFTVTVAATTFAVAVNDVLCDPLPAGTTSVTTWDTRSVLASTTKVSF